MPDSPPFPWPAEALCSVRALREHLLGRTLEHAARTVPYYRAHWGEAWRKVATVAELPALPFLMKEEATEAQESLIAGGMSSYVGVVSSGTSHGDRRPLRVPRLDAEAQALLEFEQARREHARRGTFAASGGAPPEDPGLVLEVRGMNHGLPEGAAPPDVIRIPWTTNLNGLRLFEELICRPQHNGREVTALLIGAGALVAVTLYLLEKEVDPSGFKIREIGTTGSRLSGSWRRLIERVWGASLYDNLSLSEFTTPAFECKDCGFNHWLSPPLIWEVVDAFDRTPLSSGTGALVLTSLYPFVQGMPLIRYWTGDLVEIGPPCSHAEEPGIRWRGRLGQTVVQPGLPGEPIVVSPADVQEFLDGCPEVGRLPHPCETLGLVRSPDAGVVKFEVRQPESPSASPRVRVELRFDPKVFPEAAERIGTGLAQHLLGASKRLRQLEDTGEGELEIELLPPGKLHIRWTKF